MNHAYPHFQFCFICINGIIKTKILYVFFFIKIFNLDVFYKLKLDVHEFCFICINEIIKTKILYVFFFIKIFNLDVFYKLKLDVPCTHSYLKHKTYGGAKASEVLRCRFF